MDKLQKAGFLAQNTLDIMGQIDALKAEKKKLPWFNSRRREIKERIRNLEKLEDQAFKRLELFSTFHM